MRNWFNGLFNTVTNKWFILFFMAFGIVGFITSYISEVTNEKYKYMVEVISQTPRVIEIFGKEPTIILHSFGRKTYHTHFSANFSAKTVTSQQRYGFYIFGKEFKSVVVWLKNDKVNEILIFMDGQKINLIDGREVNYKKDCDRNKSNIQN